MGTCKKVRSRHGSWVDFPILKYVDTYSEKMRGGDEDDREIQCERRVNWIYLISKDWLL